MYHTFFIHSSVSGLLDGFLILAIVNNAAINIGVWIYFQYPVIIYSFHLNVLLECCHHLSNQITDL